MVILHDLDGIFTMSLIEFIINVIFMSYYYSLKKFAFIYFITDDIVITETYHFMKAAKMCYINPNLAKNLC